MTRKGKLFVAKIISASFVFAAVKNWIPAPYGMAYAIAQE
jgi:hypothetical protein